MRTGFALLAISLCSACSGGVDSPASASSPTPSGTPTPSPTPTGVPSDPGGAGPFSVSTSTVTIPGAHSDSSSADLYTPSGAGPYPIVFLAHGFGRGKAQHVGNGEHLAGWGFVTIVPSLLHSSDHEMNGSDLAAFAQWAAGSPASLPPSADVTRIGAVGHSAGGLASTLASSGSSPFKALVGLDPVDASSLGVAAAPSVTIPVAYVLGESSSCNASANGAGMWDVLGSPARQRLRVIGATHCDFEDPTDGLCTTFCGAWDEARHTAARRYMTAWLLVRVKDDESFAPWTMSGEEIAGDPAISGLTHVP